MAMAVANDRLVTRFNWLQTMPEASRQRQYRRTGYARLLSCACSDYRVESELVEGTYFVSKGRVTLVIRPWTMANFVGHDPLPSALNHFGFKVESIEAIKDDMEGPCRGRTRRW